VAVWEEEVVAVVFSSLDFGSDIVPRLTVSR